MIHFNCDYSEGAHPKLLQALVETNLEQTFGYGEDPHCQKAAETIRALCARDVDVHFLVGGTQTNLTVISAALRPHQSVLCAGQGHIYVHETGAIEAGGHKVVPLESEEGKLTAAQVVSAVCGHYGDPTAQHMTQPKMVYISNPTELGAVYTRAELEALHNVCQAHDLILYMDGARLGYGLASPENDLDMKSIAALCDVFYIGGTKVGALFGEALVIANPDIRKDFRYIMKQKGGLLAKGRLLGIQFYELFRDGLYFRISAHAIAMANSLRETLAHCGYPLAAGGQTNQIFVALPDTVLAELEKSYACDDSGRLSDTTRLVRFCTSWATREEDIEALSKDIRRLSE